jgi:DNA-binding SARP family transcriptional activator
LHTRKALSEAFWAELDAKHGRAALRSTLLELRRLLEHSHEASERAHLRIERDTLGIEQDGSLVLDLRLVESASKLVERGGASLVRQAREELLQQLEQAASLVRGRSWLASRCATRNSSTIGSPSIASTGICAGARSSTRSRCCMNRVGR